MSQRSFQKALDFVGHSKRESWQADIERRLDVLNHTSPVRQEPREVDEAAPLPPGSGLRIQKVAQPDEQTESDRHAVTLVQGRRDFQRISVGQDIARGCTELLQNTAPEWHQTANPRVLENEEARLSELLLHRGQGTLVEFVGPGAAEPALGHRQPVVPARRSRGEQLRVQLVEPVGLEISLLIVFIRRHELGRPVTPQNGQQACKCRSARPVHSQHDNSGTIGCVFVLAHSVLN